MHFLLKYSNLVCYLVFVLLPLGGVIAGESTQAEQPTLVIWQDCEAPGGAKNWPAFPTGLIAAVWPDGRIIRAVGKKGVGQKYVEGKIERLDTEDFFNMLKAPSLLGRPDKFLVAIDGPSQTVIIQQAGKKHQWTRDIPDDLRPLNEIENRVWRLLLVNVHPVDVEKESLERYRPR